MLCKQLIAGALLLGATCASAFGQDVSNKLQEQLVQADRGIWDAIAGSHPNMEQVNAALAPDYMDVDSGVRHSREEVLEYLRGLTKFSFQYGHSQAYLLSPTSGYVVAELTYSSVQNGTSAAAKILTTTVFSKEHGRWMAHLHEEMDLKPETP